MTDIYRQAIKHDEPYIAPSSRGVVIRKNGYFYRPGWCGYASSLGDAGRYDREVAKRHASKTEGVTVHEISEFMGDIAGQPTEVYLREVDAGTDNSCWIVCAKGDPGSIRFVAQEK